MLNNTGDTIARILSIYRHRDASPLTDAKVSPVLSLRDRSAHFGTTLKPTAWARSDKETTQFLQAMQNIANGLKDVPDKFDYAVAETYIKQLAETYQKSLLGRTSNDFTKQELLETAFERIAQARLSTPLMDAYLQASGSILQTESPRRAEEILNYVLASDNLKRSTEIKDTLHECPYAVRYAAKKFFDQVIRNTLPPGEGRIHRGGKS